ncbi:interferon-induced very large GTPase 1-like [Acipenser ruthenus]|uniref:interferon-induced very large GTPase 1-like n=1 Tax=Acipenser ruthenus TaxID=7906 RepID=UPI002742432C|nr:interferon-induced very large GTPase 1-like [Acipenser ruthenus]
MQVRQELQCSCRSGRSYSVPAGQTGAAVFLQVKQELQCPCRSDRSYSVPAGQAGATVSLQVRQELQCSCRSDRSYSVPAGQAGATVSLQVRQELQCSCRSDRSYSVRKVRQELQCPCRSGRSYSVPAGQTGAAVFLQVRQELQCPCRSGRSYSVRQVRQELQCPCRSGRSYSVRQVRQELQCPCRSGRSYSVRQVRQELQCPCRSSRSYSVRQELQCPCRSGRSYSVPAGQAGALLLQVRSGGENNSDQDQEELKKKLADVGIDPHVWLPKLREELNITRAQALQHVGFKDYQKLEHCCKQEWEKKALKKLFNIQERQNQSKQLQDERLEVFKKRQEEARLALTELQQMQENGRNRNDAIVKEKEQQLQSALQVPKEYWVRSGVPLKDLIESMHNQSERSIPLQNKKISGLLKRLGLQDYYPKKMTTPDILVIDKSSLEECQPSTEQELSFLFLQKLLMLDYRARDMFCTVKSHANQTLRSVPNVTGKMNVADFFSKSNTGKPVTTEGEPEHIHPMDIQMAIFHCADSFLWQYISTKLSFCQYALPCLVPNPFTSQIEFPSWSFVQLKKSWKCSGKSGQQSKTGKSKSHSLYEAELPTVSFIRFGRSSSSKSQILNALMNAQKHHTFFHRHCKGSSATGLLMDGVVEISWYFPGGKDDDVFDDCVAFTNLHGDARQHEKQLEFLFKAATINVVLLTDSDLNEKGNAILQELLNSPKPLICLCADREVISEEQHGTKVKIGAKSRNEADLVEDLVTTVKRLLGTSKHTSSIKTCTGIARKLGFLIDEDNEHCKEGKSLAEALLAPLRNEKLSVIKEKYLPLQGDLWHKWCKKNKELTHLQIKGNISIEQHKSNIEQDKNSLRKIQYSRAFPLNNLIKTFLMNLKSNSDATKMFFLKWMEMFLHDLTSDQLTVLDETQHIKWSEMQKLKQKGKNIESFRKELEGLSNERNASAFSLEHLLREIGQIYEALESLSNKNDLRFSLPEIAADLMISGYPVELMDGDASHVPLKWISAVLDKVIEKLGDKRVFVLSVLGIQSTGKSTLLNAMFGLQFAVSAGRCTRGAFMQLVKVKEDLSLQKSFDYVLVVDTERLRTLELGKSTLNHDSELATFVIGLGNLTLINIFGENPSDMQDVLQIAVQAFLRKKHVKLSPSCMFVHQNVGEITAGEKNMEGRRRLLEKLDDMTYTAAKQEVCEVTCFSDVIRFDVNTHIHYFAHLWEGNPPMAPPNPSYSENVQKLKWVLLSSVSQQNTLKISEFKTRIQDLWRALLAENFVFSFKNTPEIAAYRKLEEKYGEWTWKLRSHMLDIENKLNNRIENGKLESVERTYLESEMQKEYKAVTQEMECYFSEDRDREILIQWKIKIEQKLADVKQEIIGETKRKFDELVRLRKSCWDLDEKKSKYEDELLKRSKGLALRLKAKDLDEKRLEREFQALWIDWVYEVSSDMPPVKKTDVIIEKEQILIERLANESVNLRMERGSNQSLRSALDFSEYILMKKEPIIKKLNPFAARTTKEEANQLTIKLTQDIIHSITESIKEKERASVDYSPSFIHEIINNIVKEIQDFQSKEKRFVFNNDYETDLCLMLCDQAAQSFQKMHDAFQKANDPRTYLTSKKEGYFSIFRTFCRGATSTTVLADFVGNKLKEAIRQAVYKKTSKDIAGEMRADNPAFNSNRSNLENHILASLADEDNFDKFMKYIHFPKQHFEEFISQSVDRYCWSGENPRILQVFRENLDSFNSSVFCTISKSTKVVQDKNGDVPMWLDEFCSELKDDLQFARSDLKSVEYQDIKDINFLKEAMATVLENVVADLRKDFSMKSSTNKEASRTKTQEILFKQLCGCWEQCPFCSAMCTNTISGHDGDHSVTFHRPQGISGVKWHKTDNLITDICSSLVGSDCRLLVSEDNIIPFKNYREAGPRHAKWNITPDSSSQLYWKWFVCHFQTNLEEKYSMKFNGLGEIPDQWKTITKTAAIESLQ